MRILQLSVILLTMLGLNTFGSGLRKENLRKACTISISSLDTLNGYEKYYQIPDENLNKYFSDKLDSKIGRASW